MRSLLLFFYKNGMRSIFQNPIRCVYRQYTTSYASVSSFISLDMYLLYILSLLDNYNNGWHSVSSLVCFLYNRSYPFLRDVLFYLVISLFDIGYYDYEGTLIFVKPCIFNFYCV